MEVIDVFSQIFNVNWLYPVLVIIVSTVISYFKPYQRLYNGCKKVKLYFMNQLLIYGNLKEILLARFSNKERLNKIGVLATSFHRVKDIPRNLVKKDYIYLLANKDDDYETRAPIDNKQNLEKIVHDVIHKHYDQLQDKLIRIGWINDPLFNIEYDGKKQPVCEVMKQIYGVDVLWDAICAVKQNIGTDGAIKFIGNKIGICGFSFEGKKDLLLHIYETDHFTFKVFKYIFKESPYNKVFHTLISRTNQAKEWEKKSMLVEAMAFLFSSVGLDILIGGRDMSGNRRLLVAARNGEVESNHVSTMHIPVNESFSNTDVDGDVYSLTTCVIRGIKEELGIPKEMIDLQKIFFHDFAIVADEGEIGFGCYVDLSEKLPLEQCRMYPGQDKFLELNNIFILPYPKFKRNPDDYEDVFYNITGDDRFCMRWQSFATLIYQRAIVRNSKPGAVISTLLEMILLAVLVLLLAYIFDVDWGDELFSTILSGVVAIFIYYIMNKPKFFIKQKGLFKPFISQWNGDCQVLQSTVDFMDDERDKMLKDSRRFGLFLSNTSTTKDYNLSELSLVMPPFCSVRKKSHDYSEYPISFYYMEQGCKIGNKLLKFVNIPYYRDDNGMVTLSIGIEKENEMIKNIKFIDSYKEEVQLTFDKSFTEAEIEAYNKYYQLDKAILSGVKYATLSDHFMSNYEFYDLFVFDSTYYWSIHGKNQSRPTQVYQIGPCTTPKEVYDIIKDKSRPNSLSWFALQGQKIDMVKFISEFTARNDNRNRISDLDLYVMQLFLIRKGFVFAKVKGGCFEEVS